MFKQLLCLLFFVISFSSFAGEYQTNEEFLQQAFVGQAVPKAKLLWIKSPLKQTVADILQHRPSFLRTRYWQLDNKTVWILNETGKTKPISVGIIIENNQISLVKVLAFRESRGWEVKHDFFTNQFKQAQLTDNQKLSQPIDGISGATLSVRALTKLSTLALVFNQHIQP